jgi:hypothetical protein
MWFITKRTIKTVFWKPSFLQNVFPECWKCHFRDTNFKIFPCLRHKPPPQYFIKCPPLIKCWRGVLSFLDKVGGVLKIKVMRLGAALKKFNIWYLSPTAPPPIINDRSLSALFEPAINDMQGDSAAAAAISDYRHNTGRLKKTLWKFNRLSCIINLAKQFNFYIGRKSCYFAFLWYRF